MVLVHFHVVTIVGGHLSMLVHHVCRCHLTHIARLIIVALPGSIIAPVRGRIVVLAVISGRSVRCCGRSCRRSCSRGRWCCRWTFRFRYSVTDFQRFSSQTNVAVHGCQTVFLFLFTAESYKTIAFTESRTVQDY